MHPSLTEVGSISLNSARSVRFKSDSEIKGNSYLNGLQTLSKEAGEAVKLRHVPEKLFIRVAHSIFLIRDEHKPLAIILVVFIKALRFKAACDKASNFHFCKDL